MNSGTSGTVHSPIAISPWYHVLADGSDQIYYPAESSLEPDDESSAVENPYVAHFFTDFANGRYLRNDRPWPGREA